MKILAAFVAVFGLVFCAAAEAVPTVFDGAFSLVLPDTWQEIEAEYEPDGPALIACLSDGQTALEITREPIPDRNTDPEAYMLQLQENGHPEAFISAFTDAEDAPWFVLYSDPENSVAMCSTIIHEKGIYTFSFSPVAPDDEYGQMILDMLATFTVTDDTGAE